MTLSSPPIIVALVSVAGVLVGAALQYVFGRSLEVRKHVQLQKGSAYADYFRAFAAIATTGRTEATLSLLADAKTRKCVYGSARVIAALGKFERAGAATSDEKNHSLVSKLLIEMRSDAGGSKTIPDEDDVRIIIFGER